MTPGIRMLFMGKNKDSVAKALGHAISLGVEIVAVVIPVGDGRDSNNSELYNIAKSFRLPVCSDTDVYEYLAGTKIMNFSLKDIDIVISFLFPKKIRKPLINLARLGCINFHSAPLPKYRGWGVYNAAILNNEKTWGVSAHFVDENFDTGDIIKINHFGIDSSKETAYTLESKSQEYLIKLFEEVVGMVVRGEVLPRNRQEIISGTTYTKQSTIAQELINLKDTKDIIDTKIRAFWFPPFGARIILDGKEYFLITSEIIKDIAEQNHKQ